MTPRQIIEKKRNGEQLTASEIGYFIREYMSGEITDYHASALLMAVFLNGMTPDETYALTRELRDSGEVLDLSSIPGKKVDKHSTGGVGDKTSLVLAPIAAVYGVTVPMITGRALGHTGGTLDKLQSIPGFDPQPSPRKIVSLLRRHGAVLMGQTDKLAPADARLYALRDATGTVESIPLITASVMSKKLVEDIDGLVLDVKTGAGAFMPTEQLSIALARSLAEVCIRTKIRTAVVVTDMDQPLGRAVGNALEVKECLDFLNGNCPEDLETVSLALAAEMVYIGGAARNEHQAMRMAYEAVSSGAARKRFFDMVDAQGGDVRTLENPELLPKARNVKALKAKRSGFVVRAHARLLGRGSNILGAGRLRTDERVDPAVGLYLHKKVGDWTKRGEVLCDIHWNEEGRLREAMPLIEQAFEIADRPAPPRPLIHAVTRG